MNTVNSKSLLLVFFACIGTPSVRVNPGFSHILIKLSSHRITFTFSHRCPFWLLCFWTAGWFWDLEASPSVCVWTSIYCGKYETHVICWRCDKYTKGPIAGLTFLAAVVLQSSKYSFIHSFIDRSGVRVCGTLFERQVFVCSVDSWVSVPCVFQYIRRFGKVIRGSVGWSQLFSSRKEIERKASTPRIKREEVNFVSSPQSSNNGIPPI
jgi:hypothetical protein